MSAAKADTRPLRGQVGPALANVATVQVAVRLPSIYISSHRICVPYKWPLRITCSQDPGTWEQGWFLPRENRRGNCMSAQLNMSVPLANSKSSEPPCALRTCSLPAGSDTRRRAGRCSVSVRLRRSDLADRKPEANGCLAANTQTRRL